MDGVDYNWEYPGYQFGRGYMPDDEVDKDYAGLLALVKETRELLGDKVTMTMSYYPDGRQESLLVKLNAPKFVDLFHAMAYDAGGEHSTMELFQKATTQGEKLFGGGGQQGSTDYQAKVTIGLPFYGRSIKNGDWKSYEDLQKDNALVLSQNKVGDQYFNGVKMIRKKVRHAIERGMGGVMIWEVGQDCRVQEKKTGDVIHVQTCKSKKNSLLLAITNEILLLQKEQNVEGSSDVRVDKEEEKEKGKLEKSGGTSEEL